MFGGSKGYLAERRPKAGVYKELYFVITVHNFCVVPKGGS